MTHRALKTALFVIAVVGASACTDAGRFQNGSVAELERHLDERVPEIMSYYDVPGVALAIVKDSALVLTTAYGRANREQRRPMATNVAFRAESISKSVTAWGVMRLVDQGRIDLNAPVERYLSGWEIPESPYDETAVTVRRLLSHTAGFPLGPIGVEEEYRPNSEVPAVPTYLRPEARLVRSPGSAFSYSNVGYNLLELMVERVTNRTFSAYMADQVLKPLGMNNSSFAWTDSLGGRLAAGYEWDGTPVAPYVYPVQAAGGLLTTVGDLGRFVCAEVGRSPVGGSSILKPESRRRLHLPETEISGLYGIVAEDYGLGHFLETLPDGHRAAWHGGQGHGWMTHYHLVPATGDGIVILTNSERSWPLMANILEWWGSWSGVGAVKMTRISDATTGLYGLTALLGLLVLWLAYRLAYGLSVGARSWTLGASRTWKRQLLQGLVALSIFAILGWSIAQPYLVLTSIFPVGLPWAGLVLFLLGVTLLASALFPQRTSNAARG